MMDTSQHPELHPNAVVKRRANHALWKKISLGLKHFHPSECEGMLLDEGVPKNAMLNYLSQTTLDSIAFMLLSSEPVFYLSAHQCLYDEAGQVPDSNHLWQVEANSSPSQKIAQVAKVLVKDSNLIKGDQALGIFIVAAKRDGEIWLLNYGLDEGDGTLYRFNAGRISNGRASIDAIVELYCDHISENNAIWQRARAHAKETPISPEKLLPAPYVKIEREDNKALFIRMEHYLYHEPRESDWTSAHARRGKANDKD